MAFRSVPRPSSPPGAKASTECPYRAREHPGIPPSGEPRATHHAQEPSTPHDALSQGRRCKGPATRQATSLSTLHAPLNTLPGRRTSNPPRQEQTDHPVSSSDQARPETHQNLIHTFKRPTARQHPDPRTRPPPRRTARRARPPPTRVIPHAMPNPISSLQRTQPDPDRTQTPEHKPWRHRSKSSGGGDRDRTDDPLLAKQVLSQLSYTPTSKDQPHRGKPQAVVGRCGGPGRIRTSDPTLIKRVL